MSTLHQQLRDHYRRYLKARHLLMSRGTVSYTIRQGSGLLPANCRGAALDAFLDDRYSSSAVVSRHALPFSPSSTAMQEFPRERLKKYLFVLLKQIVALHNHHKRD